MKTQSINRKLSRFIYALSFDELPNEVVDRAKNRILDALSIAIAGRDFPIPRIGLNLVRHNKGKATVFTHSLRIPAVDAALVNSLLANTLSQGDFSYGSHAGAVVVPATIAAAEEEGNTGAEVITAVVVGYDIMARIYLGAPSIAHKFRGTSVYGSFGAAAAAGKLLKLNEDGLTNALSLAANFSSGLLATFQSGTMETQFHGPMASRNGIMAAALAKEGVTAAEESLEAEFGFYKAFAGTNEGLNVITADLGKRFFIMDGVYKPFVGCSYQLDNMALVLNLVKQYDIKAEDIDNIVEMTPGDEAPYVVPDYLGPFKSRLQAVMSGQFSAAATFLGKPITSNSFWLNNYDDPEVVELAKKIKYIRDKKRDTIRFEVTLRDGKQHSIEGHRFTMTIPTMDKIKVKFEELALDFLGREKTDRIMDIVLNLDKINNINQLTKLLR